MNWKGPSEVDQAIGIKAVEALASHSLAPYMAARKWDVSLEILTCIISGFPFRGSLPNDLDRQVEVLSSKLGLEVDQIRNVIGGEAEGRAFAAKEYGVLALGTEKHCSEVNAGVRCCLPAGHYDAHVGVDPQSSTWVWRTDGRIRPLAWLFSCQEQLDLD